MSILKGQPLDSEKYRVIRELGRGGMGVVYLAEDQLLKREVALKVLYEHLNRDHTFVEQFQEEARSVSTLHHPNIVCVHGLERSGDVVAIDMEYVDGLSLDQFRHAANITPHIAAGIARDVLGGLATCHQIGVVHRDIKPSNILINHGGQAKITDFGLATAYAFHLEATVRGNTSSGFYMGTPRYMPVQAWEGGRPEPFWDLYSFGVVLFETLSGRVAFEGDNPMAIMKRHLTEPLPPLHTITGNVSPALSALVQSLLASSGEVGGMTSADALEALRQTPEYQELHESNADTTLALPPPRRLRRLQAKPLSRRTLGRITTALAVLLIASLAIGLAVGLRKTAVETRIPLDGSPVFLDVRALDSDVFDTGTWMVERDPQGSPKKITGITALGLWVMDVQPPTGGGQNTRLLVGSWAETLSEENRVAHFGQLAGSLAWEPDSGRMTLSLDRTRERDGEHVRFSVYGRANTAYNTRSFLRALEANAVLQPLIYSELLGRSLQWARDLEARLPSLPGGRGSRVPVPWTESPIVVDGSLTETTWVDGAFDEIGRIGEIRIPGASADTPLLVRWTTDAIYLAARVTDAGNAPVFELGVLPVLETSLKYAGRFFMSVDSQGAVQSRYLAGNAEQPWQCEWKPVLAVKNGVATVEIRIPMAALKDAARPHDQKRWRVNARMTAESSSGTRATRARWGDEDLDALEHGVLLIFRDNTP